MTHQIEKHRKLKRLSAGAGRSTRRALLFNQRGVTLVELLTGLTVLVILGAVFSSFLSALIQGGGRENSRAMMIGSGRNGVDAVATIMRGDFVQFVNDAATLGINFDLDDNKEVIVRDAMLFYIDENKSALLYSEDANAKPVSAGFDDKDGDGQADVVGIGLVIQDNNGDGVQDFVDVDHDGAADDVDFDKKGDLLWRLVLARFPNIISVQVREYWESGQTLASNVFVKYTGSSPQLKAENIDTFSYFSRDPAALTADKNRDGIVDETELGSLDSGGGVIDSVTEVAAIDGIIMNLHIVATRTNQRDTLYPTEDITSYIRPRAIALFRQNGIIGLADANEAKHVN